MNTSIDQREVEALVQGYLENTLTKQESARLHALLRQNPAHVELILNGLRDDLLIRGVIAEWMVESPVKPARRVLRPAAFRDWVCYELTALTRNDRIAAVVGGLALVAVCSIIWLWCFGPAVGTPVLAEMHGGGIILERPYRSFSPSIGTSLRDGDSLRTDGGSTAVIRFAPEETRITLLPDTRFKLKAVSQGKHFELVMGKIEASVARQRPFRPMILETPHAEARVLGTKFTLTVSSNATRLDVTQGTVRFTRSSDEEFVRVGADHFAVAAVNYELSELPASGSILCEYWTNAQGNRVITHFLSNSKYPDHPSGRDYLTNFETFGNWGTNYGARIRGHLLPPVSGDYTFWITAGDGGDLSLSPDGNPDHRQVIAHWEGLQNFMRQSAPIPLKAGGEYYIEVLQRSGISSSHLAVEWQGPDRNREVISGEFLSPWKQR